MDAREYDRIADLLMQIRKKIDKISEKEQYGRHGKEMMLFHLEMVLKYNHKLAEYDGKGWL